MSSAQPHLASWERRLVAAALDGSLLLIVGLFASAVLGSSALWGLDFFFVLAGAYVVYQSATLLRPEYSLGRTVAGIVVVPIGASELSVSQSFARPMVRIGLLLTGYFAGNIFLLDWLVAIPGVVELVLIVHTPSRRTITDRMVGTIVVKRPPPQPHRAPAYPMYSKRDDEFGPKP